MEALSMSHEQAVDRLAQFLVEKSVCLETIYAMSSRLVDEIEKRESDEEILYQNYVQDRFPLIERVNDLEEKIGGVMKAYWPDGISKTSPGVNEHNKQRLEWVLKRCQEYTESILEIDQELMKRIDQLCGDLRDDIGKISQGKKIVHAYGKNST
jgi:hypothetical protein